MALSFTCNASFHPQQQNHQLVIEKQRRHKNSSKSFEAVKNLIKRIGIPSISSSPLESLRKGNWVKLICGASFEDVVDIRNLSLVYTLAGVDCIDCAADESVVTAVNEGIDVAEEIGGLLRRPWVMISVNDDEDIHFRKAEFDPEDCPPDCSRPCEMVCPANAISLELIPGEDGSTHLRDACGKFQGGVVTERCYGCGRCIPICPYDKIRATTYVRNAAETSQLLKRSDVDAIEIHTSGRQTDYFKELWNRLGDSVLHANLVAVSLPHIGDSTIATMDRLFSIMASHLGSYNLWQLDGRPMSGDIGRGATREAIAFAVQLAALRHRPHGFLQLAGGTNLHTVDGLKKAGLFQKTEKGSQQALIGGVAYGGYARKIVGRVLSRIQSDYGLKHLEDHPDYLLDAVTEALTLVGTVKCYNFPS